MPDVVMKARRVRNSMILAPAKGVNESSAVDMTVHKGGVPIVQSGPDAFARSTPAEEARALQHSPKTGVFQSSESRPVAQINLVKATRGGRLLSMNEHTRGAPFKKAPKNTRTSSFGVHTEWLHPCDWTACVHNPAHLWKSAAVRQPSVAIFQNCMAIASLRRTCSSNSLS